MAGKYNTRSRKQRGPRDSSKNDDTTSSSSKNQGKDTPANTNLAAIAAGARALMPKPSAGDAPQPPPQPPADAGVTKEDLVVTIEKLARSTLVLHSVWNVSSNTRGERPRVSPFVKEAISVFEKSPKKLPEDAGLRGKIRKNVMYFLDLLEPWIQNSKVAPTSTAASVIDIYWNSLRSQLRPLADSENAKKFMAECKNFINPPLGSGPTQLEIVNQLNSQFNPQPAQQGRSMVPLQGEWATSANMGARPLTPAQNYQAQHELMNQLLRASMVRSGAVPGGVGPPGYAAAGTDGGDASSSGGRNKKAPSSVSTATITGDDPREGGHGCTSSRAEMQRITSNVETQTTPDPEVAPTEKKRKTHESDEDGKETRGSKKATTKGKKKVKDKNAAKDGAEGSKDAERRGLSKRANSTGSDGTAPATVPKKKSRRGGGGSG